MWLYLERNIQNSMEQMFSWYGIIKDQWLTHWLWPFWCSCFLLVWDINLCWMRYWFCWLRLLFYWPWLISKLKNPRKGKWKRSNTLKSPCTFLRFIKIYFLLLFKLLVHMSFCIRWSFIFQFALLLHICIYLYEMLHMRKPATIRGI